LPIPADYVKASEFKLDVKNFFVATNQQQTEIVTNRKLKLNKINSDREKMLWAIAI
jgi:hypothetical protein